MLDDIDGSYAGELLCLPGVDGDDLAVRNRGIDHAGVEHAGKLDVGRVLALAHRLGGAVVARGGFADVREFGICWREVAARRAEPAALFARGRFCGMPKTKLSVRFGVCAFWRRRRLFSHRVASEMDLCSRRPPVPEVTSSSISYALRA